MNYEAVHIEDMLLRVPGLTREEAVRLGREVSRRIADQLPPQSGYRRLSSLNLQLRISEHTPKHQLAELISDRILEGLQ